MSEHSCQFLLTFLQAMGWAVALILVPIMAFMAGRAYELTAIRKRRF